MSIADCVTLIRFLTGTDSNSFTNANVLIMLNAAQERISGRILTETSGGGWKWGDINYTALPTYTQNLVAGTSFYAIDALTGPLVILGTEVLNQDGIGHPLNPITLEEIHAKGIAQSEYYKTNGLPVEYQKREHAVILHPAPAAANVTLTNGLTIFFLRGMSAVTDATSTTAIGFPLPWHDYLAYATAHTFAVAKGLANVNQLKAEMIEKERDLLKFIAIRNQDDRPIMTTKSIVYI